MAGSRSLRMNTSDGPQPHNSNLAGPHSPGVPLPHETEVPRPHTIRTVANAGARLAVFEYGARADSDHPVLLLVHGFPDDHRIFEPLIAELRDEYRILTYDTRNAGQSTTDDDRLERFRLQRLVEDMFAVIASADAGPVHVFGHDWGSIQAWHAAEHPWATRYLASLMSVSGPNLNHMRQWIRLRRRRPSAWPVLARQMTRSWYVSLFQVPVLPELLWRLTPRHSHPVVRGRTVTPEFIRGLALYRANILPYMARGPQPRCQVPAAVVVPLRDVALSPALVDGVGRWVPRFQRMEVDAEHWWPFTHPRDCATRIRGWIGLWDRTGPDYE